MNFKNHQRSDKRCEASTTIPHLSAPSPTERSIVNPTPSPLGRVGVGLSRFSPHPMPKSELAKLYFPTSTPANARRNFNRMLTNAVGLMPALTRLGYALHSDPTHGTVQSRILTTAMVRTIVYYCGEP